LQRDERENEREDAAQLPERSDQAQQEHETFERKSGREALLREEPSGLVPARIERDPAQAADQREAPGRLVCGQPFELQPEPSPQLGRDVYTDRQIESRRAHAIFELCVEEALVPEELSLCRQRRTIETCARGRIAHERAVGQNGDPRLARNGDQWNAVLAQLDLARGGRGDLLQLVVDAGEIEETRAALRQPETREQVERDPDERPEAVFLRPGKSLQDNFRRKVGTVRGRAPRKGEDSEKRDQAQGPRLAVHP